MKEKNNSNLVALRAVIDQGGLNSAAALEELSKIALGGNQEARKYINTLDNEGVKVRPHQAANERSLGLLPPDRDPGDFLERG